MYKTTSYILKSYQVIDGEMSSNKKLYIFLKLYLFVYLVSLAFSILINIFNELFYNQLNVNSYDSFTGNVEKYLILLAILFFSPLYEELAFRLWLGKLNFKYFKISFSLLCGLISVKSIRLLIDFNIFNFPTFDTYFLLIIFFGLYYTLYSFIFNEKIKNELMYFWKFFFKSIYFINAIIFTFLHYNSFSGILYFNSFFQYTYLIPVFILSLTLGFLRINFGFKYCLFFHFLFNLPAIILNFIFV
jgi:hypothetical protein